MRVGLARATRGVASSYALQNSSAPGRDVVGCGAHSAPPMSKLSVLGEFWRFLRVRKKFWLAPIVLVLVLLGLLVASVSGSPLAPFVYALF